MFARESEREYGSGNKEIVRVTERVRGKRNSKRVNKRNFRIRKGGGE